MIARDGKVLSLDKQWDGCAQITVMITKAPPSATMLGVGTEIRAVFYPNMVGNVRVDDTVRLECSALAKSLGTGGYAMVQAIINRLPDDALPDNDGHVVKARYTPSQIMVSSVDEQQSPYHHVMADARRLNGTPVIVTDLHSAVPAIIAGIRSVNPTARIAYVYTDGGALPAWFSMAISTLRHEKWLEAVFTAGQACGGDYECASLPSALLAAERIVDADIIIVAQGPGNLGTGTPFGYSGVDVAWALTCAHQIGGKPVAALRVSDSDARDRHLGISHHMTRVLRDLTPTPVAIVKPVFSDSDLGGQRIVEKSVTAFNKRLDDQLHDVTIHAPHHSVYTVDVDGVKDELQRCPVRLSSMGRRYDDDATPFLAAAAAGAWTATTYGNSSHQ